MQLAIPYGPATPAEQLDAVKRYAQHHYHDGQGWDAVVEFFDDAELAKLITGCSTRWGAIELVREEARDFAGYRLGALA